MIDLNDPDLVRAASGDDIPYWQKPRYVTTDAAQRMVEGREGDLIRAAGIQWHGKHICCPYRDHDDHDPSWRLLDSGRAICTCSPHSDSVFDVLIKIGRATDFEEAKVVAAELLGRGDAIVVPAKPKKLHSGVTLSGYASHKGLSVEFLKEIGCEEGIFWKQRAIRISYKSESGTELDPRWRISLTAKKRVVSATGGKTAVYGQWRVGDARQAGYVLLVGGESDCHTAWFAGLPCLGLPGEGNYNDDRDAALFDGIDTIIAVIEPDKGGESMLVKLQHSAIADRVKLIVMEPAEKDLSALYLAAPDQFKQRVHQLICDAVPLPQLTPEQRERAATGMPTQLKRDQNDNILPVQINAIVMLAPVIGSKIGFDEFTNRPVWTSQDEPPWYWAAQPGRHGRIIDDDFLRGATIWLQQRDCMIRAKWMVHEALMTLWNQKDNRYNGLIKFLDSCRMMEKPYCSIDTFFIAVMGVAEFGPMQDLWNSKENRWVDGVTLEQKQTAALHQRYVRAQSRYFFMRAVARARQPGRKADEIPNIQGEEGIKKSTVIEKLFTPWYAAQLPRHLDSKETDILLSQGLWHIEIADGSHLKRTNADDFKNWASRTHDHFRAPYDKEAKDHPRRLTFSITTNDYENLVSLTGNRRLPTLECRWCKPELLTDELRAHLFAEADAALDSSDSDFWITDDDLREYAADIVDQKVEESVYFGLIESSLNKLVPYKFEDIMTAIGFHDKLTWKLVQTDVKKALAQRKWRSKSIRMSGSAHTERRWIYTERAKVT